MKKLYALLSISILLLLNACSDYADDIKDEYQERLTAGSIECDKYIEGTQVSTIDGGDRICKDGAWSPVVSDHPKSSSSNTTTHLSSTIQHESKSSSSESNQSSSSSSSAVTALYLCPDGSHAVDYESCEKEDCKKYSGDLVCLEDIIAEHGECVENIEDSIGLVSRTYFICKNSAWSEANTFEVDTYRWESGKDGDTKFGQIQTENCYVYDTSSAYNNWRIGDDIDCELGFGGCTHAKEGITQKTESNSYFSCIDLKWVAASKFVIDTYGWVPDTIDGAWKTGNVNVNEYYVFDKDNNGWRASISEEDHSEINGCTARRQGEMDIIHYADDINEVYYETEYICFEKKWFKAREMQWDLPRDIYLNPSITYGILEDDRDNKSYKTVTIEKGEFVQTWMAQNLNYLDSVSTTSLKKHVWCGAREYENWTVEEKKCDVAGAIYDWSAAIDSLQIYKEFGKKCGAGKNCLFDTSIQGICPNGWRLPTSKDWDKLYDIVGGEENLKSRIGWGTKYEDKYGFAGIPNFNDKYDVGADWYNEFIFLSSDQLSSQIYGHSQSFGSIRCVKDPLPESCETENSVYEYGNAFYICHSSKWEKTDWATYTYGACTSHKENEIEKGPIGGVYYMCSEGAWIETPYSYGNCNTSRENELVSFENDFYLCKNETWEPVTQLEYENGICTLEIEGKIASISSSREGYYTCTNEKWEYINTCPTDKEEGETFFLDGCHSCRCSKGALVCRGC
ncbi:MULTISPECIES: FISUMP domain-containing protein [unclassified Fibrobacter]|uniref:FISUMP domain-containing protein n=1 Tax=unclassified Fibrobacter TaxID=2634177 RepID=UPI000D6C5D70|nr:MULTISPECIES: FISUMP domain-containing protein [unclassified Fibrobacter]PWJ68338.1 uncharacterized protein (TIGR02145 family) [Fibrobacter sp. UWR4]PZW68128.1 uncharacterized protein (TIGR02145 family) [Fibrobacter sp. UWR1]